MSPGDAWATLGIEPTDDSRAVRSAYSQRLKEIDVDADPKAFIALRDAFECIKRAGGPLTATHDLRDLPASPTDAPEPDSAVAALEALLHGTHAERSPSAGEAEAMLMHWWAVLSDPRMDTLSHYGDVEVWTSEAIANATPFSDPLVIPAVEYFGWTLHAGSIHASKAVAAVLDRYRALCPLAEAAGPDDYLHIQWRNLHRPQDAVDLLSWNLTPFANSDTPSAKAAYLFGDAGNLIFPSSSNIYGRPLGISARLAGSGTQMAGRNRIRNARVRGAVLLLAAAIALLLCFVQAATAPVQ